MIRQLAKVLRSCEVSYWTLKARLQFRLRGTPWPKGLTVKGPLGLSCQGQLEIGCNVSIVSLSKFNRAGINHLTQIVAGEGAKLAIGDNVGISGAAIYCTKQIIIGNHVLIGVNCKIYDNDFHPLDYMDRRHGKNPAMADVIVEDDVWLCANVIVLKGVKIGARSVIAAGSVVSKNIPSDTLAGGVPAKPIRIRVLT